LNTTRSEGTLTNLPYALFYAGEFTEARKRAETLNPQPNKAMELHNIEEPNSNYWYGLAGSRSSMAN